MDIAMTDTRKWALVTGFAKRIGRAISRELHASGYDIVGHFSTSKLEAQELVDEFNASRTDSARSIQADLSTQSGWSDLTRGFDALGLPLDLLVNNASQYFQTPVAKVDEAVLSEFMRTNAIAPIMLCLHFAPSLAERRGAIVNIIDVFGERPLKSYLPYCLSKSTLRFATLALAKELAPNVRVNAVSPGNILWSDNAQKADTEADVQTKIPMQSQGRPEDIAEAVRWLGTSAPYVTGQVVSVDGGRLLHI